ncbi:hypothetical protein WME94_45610 [Sorangium sp. So ce429]
MQMVTVPQLYCPFPSRINPRVEEIDRHTTDWLREFELLRTEQMHEKFRRYKFAWMTARVYPDADYDLLCAANDLYTWLFILDDQLDHLTPETAKIREKASLQEAISNFVDILRYDRTVPRGTDAILASLSDFWARMKPMSRPSWQCQFILGLRATFEAAIWEAGNARKGRHPFATQYMQMRPWFAGANIGTDMIEVAAKVHLPVYVLQHEHFVRLVDLSRRAVCWANDLFSLSKEVAHGDEHNLVLVLKQERGTTLEEAIQETAQIHDAEIRLFEELRGRLPSFGDEIDADVARYVDALGIMIRGFMDWSIYDTARYQFVYDRT